MKRRVYLETTIVSYLAARPSRDLIVAAHQELTREWWDVRRSDFELHMSQLVLDEASGGDPTAARRRLDLLEGIPRVPITEQAIRLAEDLVRSGLMPSKAAGDALHVAVATAHQMDVLLTWNCRHLANAELVQDIGRHLRSLDMEPPVLCTPAELMGD